MQPSWPILAIFRNEFCLKRRIAETIRRKVYFVLGKCLIWIEIAKLSLPKYRQNDQLFKLSKHNFDIIFDEFDRSVIPVFCFCPLLKAFRGIWRHFQGLLISSLYSNSLCWSCQWSNYLLLAPKGNRRNHFGCQLNLFNKNMFFSVFHCKAIKLYN